MTQATSDFHRAVEVKLLAGAKAAYPSVPVYTPNAKWPPVVVGPWIRYDIIPAKAEPLTIGGKRERTTFVLMLSIFAPVETYDRSYLDMAEALARLFAGQRLAISAGSTAVFRAPKVASGPDAVDGKYQVIATITGYRDTDLSQP